MRRWAYAILVITSLAWAGPNGTLRVTATTHKCGTCGMPPGQPERAKNTKLLLIRGGKKVAEATTDDAGKASFTIPGGSYCVTDVAVVAPAAKKSCTGVVAGKVSELQIDLTQCGELHCTGREP